MDYIKTVRQRYQMSTILQGQFTLQYPKKEVKEEPAVPRKERLRDMLRPQLSGFTRKIQDEISAIINRWTSTREKTLFQTINKQMETHSSVWNQKWDKTEKARVEHQKRNDQRTQLLFRNTEKQIKTLEKNVNELLKREKEKKQADERMEIEEKPVSRRKAREMIENSSGDLTEAISREMYTHFRRRTEHAVRQMQSKQQYDEMRRMERK